MLSVLVAVAAQVIITFPQYEPIIRTAVTGLVVWLMATGTYEIGKNINEKIKEG